MMGFSSRVGASSRRLWGLLLLVLLLFPVSLKAHNIDQIYLNLTVGEEEWSGEVHLNGLMLLEIAAGGKVAEDGSNKWFAGLDAAQAAALVAQAETFWRTRFFFSINGQPCPYEFSCAGPEALQKEARQMPYNPFSIPVKITGRYPPQGGSLEVRWENNLAPNLLLACTLPGAGSAVELIPLRPGEPRQLTEHKGRTDVASKPVVAERAPPSLWLWVRFGFEHILPKGLDHILFILGLFLLAPKWRPLLWQSTAFTLAHSLTLALVVTGVLTVSSKVVEPLIALSIAYVAVENLFLKDLKWWRLGLVFCLGLLHGMGFASVMQQLDIPSGQIVRPLVGFNLGVELGQITVLAGGFLVVFALLRQESHWRKVRFVGSLAIAITGLVWTVQRLLG